MADVLSQSEVESLLAALESDIAPAQMATPAVSGHQTASHHFNRPPRVSTEQMRAIRTLHGDFTREFGAGLSGLLRTVCDVTLGHVEQITYAEFVSSLPSPTCFNLIESKGLE